jgi:flagellar biosynthesis/type III secretory pathway chaperone
MSTLKLARSATPGEGGLIAELAAESVVVSRFIALLKVEQRALKEGFVDSLKQLAQEKSTLVTDLGFRQAKRERDASTADGAGIERWIARNGGAAAIRSWRQLLECAREAQRLNHVNRILVDTLARNNRQALNVLQGAAQRASLYGRDGLNQNYTGGRILGAV